MLLRWSGAQSSQLLEQVSRGVWVELGDVDAHLLMEEYHLRHDNQQLADHLDIEWESLLLLAMKSQKPPSNPVK